MLSSDEYFLVIYIGVIGASSCDEKIATFAYKVGMAVAESGAILVCGGMGGVMTQACRGAREAEGITIGILPGDSRLSGNPYLTYAIPTGLGEARNSIVVKSSDAVVAVDGSYGTLSEIAFALKWGKPVAGIGTWELKNHTGETAPITYFKDPVSAVKWAVESASIGKREI
ncbi:MAG: TIGR00725 family protein [Candidatus Eremiobacteraeota bacterium]|nr:TIGR00725 family protein [Candidatus Eremiobacteraeota bacterium]